MTDRPIIFSAPMVRALLEGRKTQTRRLLFSHALDPTRKRFAPWARVLPRDRLWARESFAESDNGPVYRADHAGADTAGWGWRPSIHMPRWASRITLTVTDVRREPLQDISEEDARAEGVEQIIQEIPGGPVAYRDLFRAIWLTLHGAESWQANPEVVPITFTVGLHNIDQQRSAA